MQIIQRIDWIYGYQSPGTTARNQLLMQDVVKRAVGGREARVGLLVRQLITHPSDRRKKLCTKMEHLMQRA